jgi:1-acyl-sn-glycerol-3-phosphate acyltransferase
MAALRSALFMLLFYGTTSFAVLVALVAMMIGPGPLRAVVRWWLGFHRWCAAVLLGITTRIEGPVPHGACLVAAKHQSMFETLELARLLDGPAVVLKRELADLPLWGAAARKWGVIPVDRSGGSAALRRMMKAAEATIAAGRSILIFPEGTRVSPGEQPPLQPGFAGLYRALGMPVVPVALDSGRLWPRRGFVKRPGIVTFRFGEPIPKGMKRDEIEAQVHAAINALEQPL